MYKTQRNSDETDIDDELEMIKLREQAVMGDPELENLVEAHKHRHHK